MGQNNDPSRSDDAGESLQLPNGVDDPSSLPEGLRPYYAKNEDGRWRPRIPSDDAGFSFERTAPLRTALESTKAKLEETRGRLSQLQGLSERLGDRDLDELLSVEEKVRSGSYTPKDELERREAAVRKQLAEKYDGQVSDLRKENESLHTELHRTYIESSTVRLCAEMGAAAELLLPVVNSMAQVREVEDVEGRKVRRAVVLNENGQPRVSLREGDSGLMTIEELVKEVLPKDSRYERAFARATGGNVTEQFGGGGRRGSTDEHLKKLKPQARFSELRRRYHDGGGS